MGIYDRDYYRGPERSASFSHGPWSVVGLLIAINVAVWLVDGLLFEGDLSRLMAARVWTLTHPLFWWQFLTAGFAHDPNGIGHILGNMLVLYFLGRDIEDLYGPKEFLRVYLATLVFANVVWSVANKYFAPHGGDMPVYGASGAISGIVLLYALNFPHRTLLLYFIIPMPAWVLGALVLAYDIYGATVGVQGSNVAYLVHVAGAAFALVYFQGRWNLTRFGQGLWDRLGKVFARKPRLHVHHPEEDREPDAPLHQEIDRILEKISREGESSLTARERQTLETASRQFREKMSRRQ